MLEYVQIRSFFLTEKKKKQRKTQTHQDRSAPGLPRISVFLLDSSLDQNTRARLSQFFCLSKLFEHSRLLFQQIIDGKHGRVIRLRSALRNDQHTKTLDSLAMFIEQLSATRSRLEEIARPLVLLLRVDHLARFGLNSQETPTFFVAPDRPAMLVHKSRPAHEIRPPRAS